MGPGESQDPLVSIKYLGTKPKKFKIIINDHLHV